MMRRGVKGAYCNANKTSNNIMTNIKYYYWKINRYIQ